MLQPPTVIQRQQEEQQTRERSCKRERKSEKGGELLFLKKKGGRVNILDGVVFMCVYRGGEESCAPRGVLELRWAKEIEI